MTPSPLAKFQSSLLSGGAGNDSLTAGTITNATINGNAGDDEINLTSTGTAEMDNCLWRCRP